MYPSSPLRKRSSESFVSRGFIETTDWNSISANRMLENIKILSSDAYEGRAPASRGEILTTQLIEKQFKEMGLKPGNPDGSYFQNVPLVGMTVDSTAELVFTDPLGREMMLKYADDFVACTKHEVSKVSVDADLVFVGYGVVAPEYNWDDYKGVDVKGKIIVLLINDPPVSNPNDPSKLDEKMFKGNAMTYYGRWTYKFEIAAKKGAVGCLIVHQTKPAGYGWSVVQTTFACEHFSLLTADHGMSRSTIEGWITEDKAKELFALAGRDFDELVQSAARPDFRAVNLRINASLMLNNRIRTIESKNVIAKLNGADAKCCDEYVIYTAHWDHLGMGPEVNGDKIYHGAVDNASGVAGLLEIARAYIKLPPPSRSILFLSVTAEERGLLGSQYYAEHPLYPLAKTLANINLDGLNMFGQTLDVEVIGFGRSTLDDVAVAVATEQGRKVIADVMPEKGFYFRGDQFSFAKQGVPALFPVAGIDYVDKPAGWGLKMCEKFFAETYHKPSDQVKPDWDLRGAVEDMQLLGEVGYRVANAKDFPKWKEGSEYKR